MPARVVWVMLACSLFVAACSRSAKPRWQSQSGPGGNRIEAAPRRPAPVADASIPLADVEYDEVWFVLLKFPPEGSRAGVRVFGDNGAPYARDIAGARRITRNSFLDWIDRLLADPKHFADGRCDCCLCLYSLVFYRGGEAVLVLKPNLTGGDLGAMPHPVIAPISSAWSSAGLQSFVSLCHEQMELLARPSQEGGIGALPPAAGVRSAVTQAYLQDN